MYLKRFMDWKKTRRKQRTKARTKRIYKKADELLTCYEQDWYIREQFKPRWLKVRDNIILIACVVAAVTGVIAILLSLIGNPGTIS